MGYLVDGESDALRRGRELVHGLRDAGAPLDGTDDSVWFVHGVLRTLRRDVGDANEIAAQQLGFAVYLADLLASAHAEVVVSAETVTGRVAEVTAADATGRRQHVLSWVRKAAEGDTAENVVFNYACALADFGCRARAAVLFDLLHRLDED